MKKNNANGGGAFVVNQDGTSAWAPVAQGAPKAAAPSKPAKGAPSQPASKGPAPDKAAAPSKDNSEIEKVILGHVNKHGSIQDTADFSA